MILPNAVIITAAGYSRRFNNSENFTGKKEFVKLEDGETVLSSSVKSFLSIENVKAILITYAKDYKKQTEDAVGFLKDTSNIPFFFIEGDISRQGSVFNALSFLFNNLKDCISLVSIHDGCRPFVTEALVRKVLTEAQSQGAAVPAIKVTDTLVKLDENMAVKDFVDRNYYYTIQTPQCFKFPDIYHAHLKAYEEKNMSFTDDSSVYRMYGKNFSLVEGEKSNIKITYTEDLRKIYV